MAEPAPAPAAEPQPSPTPAPTPEPTPAPAANAAWYDSIQDVETRAWAKGKGWQDLGAMATSARNLEKHMGAPADELVRVPKNGGEEAMRAVFAKLGMPESPDKYEIASVDGVQPDEHFTGWAKGTFHKLGLTASQAKAMSQEHAAYVKARMEKDIADYNASVKMDETALQNEWRGGYERMMGAAKQAAKSLGFSGDMIDGLEKTIGYAATMKFMASLGQKLGEDKFVSGDGRSGSGFAGSMTPAEAKVEYEKLLLDQDFTKALLEREHPGHKAALEKKTRLMEIIHG